ncbi:MAG: type I glyceraldehyde-3-phosphate dehydrogenase [Arenicella sp.]
MTIRIAINGYGRIGRNIVRAIFESGYKDQFDIVAINDLGDTEINAHLTQYDSAHGRFPGTVDVDGQDIIVNGDRLTVLSERDPSKLPWKKLKVDVVLECTGRFRTAASAGQHIAAGATKVIISAPAKDEVDATIVYGVNESILRSSDTVISNASCTTNCLAPLAKVLNDSVGIEHGMMTTVHAYTNDQVLTDKYHSKIRRARSATQSIIPTTTGAATAVGLVLPELSGKLNGYALRVPTINVSLVDLTFVASKVSSVEEINRIVREAADDHVLAYCEKPLVSIDYNHTATSSNFDATLTKVDGGDSVDHGTLVKVCSWYDNEWGFSNRMLDTTKALMAAK